MGKFLNGLFVGIGVGLLIAPQRGEETRRLIIERVTALRKSLSSEDDQHFLINARPPEDTTFPLQPDQPITLSSSESQELVTPSILSAQPITAASSESQGQETSSVEPAETLSTDTEDMVMPPPVPSPTNVPERRPVRRKTTTRTSGTSKTKGHDRSRSGEAQ